MSRSQLDSEFAASLGENRVFSNGKSLTNNRLELPNGWLNATLRDLIHEIRCGVSVNSEPRPVRNGEAGVLKVSCVANGRFAPVENKAVVRADQCRVATPVTAGTIVVSRSNTAALVGASAYVSESIPNLYHSDKLWQVWGNTERIIPRYLGYLLALRRVQRRLGELATGTSKSMKNISQDRFLSVSVRLPPITEQLRILEILIDADVMLNRLQSLIEAKQRFKTGLAERLLVPRSRNGDSGGAAWTKHRLGEYLKERVDRWAASLGPLVLSCSKIHGIVPQSQLFGKQLASKNLSRYKRVDPGDLVLDPMLLWDGSIRFSSLQGVVSPDYRTFHFTGSEVHRRYFHHLLASKRMRETYRVLARGSNVRRRRARVDDLLHVSVHLPASAELTQTVEVLDLVDREIALLRQQLELLKQQKQGLLEKLLSGELPIKEASDGASSD